MIARNILEKTGVTIVGAIDTDKNKIGKSLDNILGTPRKTKVEISKDTENVLRKTKPHVAIHATSSFLQDTYPQIASIVKHGVNVVSTCEELSYPYATSPRLAAKLDTLAKKYDATVLGTGINPGFLMDTLVIALTAPCQKISKIEVTRVMNAATRRLPFQRKIGAGITLEEFRQKIDHKEITGHVGLRQSIGMVADAMKWKLDRISLDPVQPIIAKQTVKSSNILVRAGQAAGLRQKAKGIFNNKEMIVLEFEAYIGAKEEYDAITITGSPNVKQKIQPCVHGDMGTVAMIVNSVPKVINAPSGLLTMKDLPVPSAATEDMRKYLRQGLA